MRNVNTNEKEDSRTFFTADTHFGHENIIKYCKRPFKNARQMDTELIERWNSVVGDEDVIYHLGDVTLRSRNFARRIFQQLAGHIHVLGYPWHHDASWLPRGECDLVSGSGHPVKILPPLVVLKFRDLVPGSYPKAVTLCHYPMARWESRHHGAWHLHGHCHGNFEAEGALMDVGVDSNDFAPVPLSRLPALLSDREETHE